MPRPVLYQSEASPPARAVMMVLDLLGVEVEKRDLNPVLREQDTPEFVKKNPMKTIPIYDEGDFAMADSHAIMIYLMEKYGKPEHAQLYPKDEKKRAKVNQRLFFDCGVLFPRLRAVMAPTYAGRLTEITKYMIKNIDDAYGMLEIYLADSVYLADNVMTIADISVLTTVSSLHGLHPIDDKRFPKLARWLLTMNEKDVSKRINKQGSELHVMGLKALMVYNKENPKSKL
nr:glutathione S-transferase epsilon 2 [Ectropis grisescens]